MYRFHAPARRIDWLYERYAGSAAANVREFVRLVNEVYYKHFASHYEERYVSDIEQQYDALFRQFQLHDDDTRTIVNVGGGAGFEYEQFLRNNIGWREYLFIEPDPEMIQLFQNRHDLTGKNVRILPGRLEEHIHEIQQISHKVILFNSCLHHVIWIESVLDIMKASLQPGDLVLFCHEPNNSYLWSPFMVLNYLLRSATTDLIPRRLGLYRSSAESGRQDCWQQVNDELMSRRITTTRLAPIAIRRMIDYGVGLKGDWKSIGVPPEYDEGHWTPRELEGYLGSEFKTVFLRMYRCLGDPGGKRLFSRMNKLCDKLFPRSGSVFCMAIQRSV
ncbi:MAG: class I SAM-dependent methyltransferase [Planctomycetales bacterium]|nr:class I SAM-dependent methyltransferase [Planctomycetales bacterium]